VPGPGESDPPPALRQARLAPTATVSVPGTIRLTGDGAAAQAAAASARLFPNGSGTVVVAGARSADMHVAAYAAGVLRAPLLIVDATRIPSATAREWERLGADRAVVVGDPSAVGDAVTDVLARTSEVTRIGGHNVYRLSHAAFRAVSPDVRTVYVADARSLATAPAAAAAAAARGRGMLLVDGSSSSLSAATVALLRDAGVGEVVLLGSSAGVSTAILRSTKAAGFSTRRITAADRAGVALLVAREYPAATTRAVIAPISGSPSAQTAVAAAVAGAGGAPLYLSGPDCLSDSVAREISRRDDRVVAVGSIAQLATPIVHGTSCTGVRREGEADLRSAISAAMSRHPSSDYTVTVRELGGLGETVAIGGATRREPASMMKLFVAWQSFARIERGAARLSTRLSSGLTVEECLRELIWMSDNYCHTDLVHWIGLSALNRRLAEAGFSDTAYGSVLRGQNVLYGGNRTSTNDLTDLLKRLDDGKLLNPTHTAHMMRLMHAQLFRSRIPNGLPPSAYQASKPGSLWVAGGLLQADSAVVRGRNGGSYVISVIGDAGSSKAGIRDISRAAYTHFNGRFSTLANHSDLHVRTTRATPWRRTPGGAVAGTIPGGTPLQVSDSQRHWYKVHYRGGYAWVWYSQVRSNLD
jgi:beta-lactamase class A